MTRAQHDPQPQPRPLRLVAGALALAALSACAPLFPVATAPTGPEARPAVLSPPAAPRDRLIAAVESQGCLITRDNRDAILLRANVTVEQMGEITRDLQAAGQVEVPPGGSGTIRLLSANCI